MRHLAFSVFLAILFCATILIFPKPVTAQAPAPAASPSAVASPAPAPSPAAPAVTPAAVPAVPPAPPAWALELLTTVEALPVVGPIVAKGLLYLGILSAILTSLVAFLLSALAGLKSVLNFAGLTTLTSALQSFQDGPIMYWLTYFSNFNAQNPPASMVAAASTKPAAS
jgi:hypothetical protein